MYHNTEHKFKINDVVKIVREHHCINSFKNWCSDMNKYIGKYGQVCELDYDGSCPSYRFYQYSFLWRESSLEKVNIYRKSQYVKYRDIYLTIENHRVTSEGDLLYKVSQFDMLVHHHEISQFNIKLKKPNIMKFFRMS